MLLDFDKISFGIKIGLWFQSCVVASYEVNDKFITNWRKIIQFWFYQCIFNCKQQSMNSKVILFIWYTNTFLHWSYYFFFILTNLMSGVIWQLNINVIISVRISINVCKVSFIKKIDIAFSESQLRLAVSMWYLDANGIYSSVKNILWWAIWNPPFPLVLQRYLSIRFKLYKRKQSSFLIMVWK